MATPLITRPLGVNDTGLPAVPISLHEVISHLAMRPRQARSFVADLADALIEAKDRLDPDPDVEEDDPLEPNCGSCTTGRHTDECEADEGDACEVEDIRGEPWLGSLDGHVNQTRWGAEAVTIKGSLDIELDRSDYEPSLGSLDSGHHPDQRKWGQSGTHDAEPNGDELDEDNRDRPRSEEDLAAWGGEEVALV